MRNRSQPVSHYTYIAAAAGLLALSSGTLAGTWTRLTNNAPGGVNLMMLLPDGSVMCAQNNGSTIGNGWYRLKPDIHGSYVNGTWTTLASTTYTRLYYPSQVLRDGRVFVAGGEYGTGGPQAEIYDPNTNAWTTITPGGALWNTGSDNFYDCNSEILPDGSVLTMPVFPHSSAVGLRYNPATNVWSNAGPLFRGSYQDEATWVKLPDNSILTIDPFGTNSERYIPTTNTWINDSTVPVSLYDPFGFELGGGLMLPNGKAFFLGSTGNNALYTPTGTNSPGTWTAAAVTPSSKGTPDAPCAMLVTGNVLCAVSPKPTSSNHFPTPTTFYEYNYVTNTFSSQSAPNGASDPISTYQAIMLALPDGNVLYSHMGNDLYVYAPGGSPIAAGKPTVTSVSANGDGSYHVVGQQLNGISEGASYGDDAQMNSNYPLVRLSDAGGNVYYARTYNWSSTGVMTGATSVTTEYRLPAGLPSAQYTLVAVANGFASDPFCTTPWVTGQPGNQSVAAGGTANFTVTATGTSLTYRWRRGTTVLSNGGRISGTTTNTLTITGLVAGDAAADYNCIVTNGCGSVTTNNASLTVTTSCPGDLDHNGSIDLADLTIALGHYGATGATPDMGDLDGNGNIDLADISIELSLYGTACP